LSRYDIVVPSIGRDSLTALLESLDRCAGPRPGAVWVVDDKAAEGSSVDSQARPFTALGVRVLRGPGRGPAAARNVGFKASSAEWIVFLDDDVVVTEDWAERLSGDLSAAGARVAGSQGRIVVPAPAGRRPTDWERNVMGLQEARWATADMAYRRSVLEEVGGFDERFARAYREDADLALRVLARGHALERGRRCVVHPVRPADRWVSVRLQAGNADDVLMAALHGRKWRDRAGAPAGRRPLHLATTAAALAALGSSMLRRRGAALISGGVWLALTAELAWRRIAPGPRTWGEVTTMVLTSAAIPAVATWRWLSGWATLPRALADEASAPRPPAPPAPPAAVLFDRDGTLVDDVAYNGDPARVVPVPGARQALDRLRELGIPTAVITNQSGVARGLLTLEEVAAVNERVEELLGPLGPWLVCPHDPEAGCDCRKPAPGLILQAAQALGVDPGRCAVIGDIGSDVAAARAAGAGAVLVPTPRTRPEEVASAPRVARDLAEAVDLLLGGRA
jgi:histidinol-phosphate phosphatase family protein